MNTDKQESTAGQENEENKNESKKDQKPNPKIRIKKQSDLTVVTKAKDLCHYVYTVTIKSPKYFRHSLVDKLHNLCIEIIENLYRANGTMVIGDKRQEALNKRLTHQSEAMVALKEYKRIRLEAIKTHLSHGNCYKFSKQLCLV